MSSVLVLGGAGYIGSHTCQLLSRNGHLPIVLDDLSTGHDWAAKFGPLVVGDIEDCELVRTVTRQYRVQDVIHFAAKAYVGESVLDPGKYFRENVAKSIRLLDTLIEQGVPRIIFSSSCTVYGSSAQSPIIESVPQTPVNPYGESKLFVERMLHWYGQAHGLKWVALRYFNAAGADPDGEIGEDHTPEPHLIPSAVDAALGRRASLEIFGTDYATPDGTAIRDYTHVADLARAHLLAMEYLCKGGESMCLNVGTGRGSSVMEVVESVSRTSGRAVPFQLRPRRAGDPAELVADPTLARRTLGWTAEFNDLDRIIATAVAWHQRTASAGAPLR